MNKYLFIPLLILVNSCTAAPEGKNCFSSPLILGASVSAGYGTEKGGTANVIAKLINNEAQIDNRAKSGESGQQSLKGLDLHSLSPSIVIGLDLFFWDAARNQCGENFVDQTRKFFKAFKDTPMIIGKIPVGVSFPDGYRMAGTRPCTKIVNKLIEELCVKENNCLIYDPRECLESMPSAQGFFMDKLHPTDKANEFCAKMFIEAGDYKKLTCS